MSNNKKSVGYWIGTILSAIVLTCLAICIGGVVVALTLKFLTWLF